MALSTTQYGYIIDPMVPFTDDKGNTIKDGFVRVFVAGSSTPVVTYRNFDGAANQDLIELDNSGRTKTSVIGSKGFTYKVCVYDAFHSQESPILTVDNVSVIGANITAGTGSTVVTGLDGLTTKPDGFVDASVVGTDGYVALDHTLVSDDLDTDAKVSAVEDDRYIPLLNDDVNDPDSKMKLGRLWQWVLSKIKSLSTTITAFRTGDVIPVDGPSGTAKMAKDDLLAVTRDGRAEKEWFITDNNTVSESNRFALWRYKFGRNNRVLISLSGTTGISSVQFIKDGVASEQKTIAQDGNATYYPTDEYDTVQVFNNSYGWSATFTIESSEDVSRFESENVYEQFGIFDKSLNIVDPNDADIKIGYYIDENGNLNANATYNTTGYIRVSPNNTYKLSTSARFIAFFHSDKSFSVTKTYQTEFTIPKNIYFIRISVVATSWASLMCALKDSYPLSFVKYKKTLKKDLLPARDPIAIDECLFASSVNLLNKNDTNVALGKYINATGGLDVNASYNTSGWIKVSNGTTYVFSTTTRFVGVYTLDKVFVSRGENLNSFTASADGYVKLSISVGSAYWDIYMMCIGQLPSVYIPYRMEIKKDVLPYYLDGGIQSYSLCGWPSQKATLASLASGVNITCPGVPYEAKKGLFFSAEIYFSSFTKVTIGKGYHIYNGAYIVIDSSNVYCYHYNGNQENLVGQSAHGLTIDTYLRVSVKCNENSHWKVTIESKGAIYTTDFSLWFDMSGVLFLFGAQAMTNVTLAGGNSDLKKPIWFFGDSYFGVNDQRWPYYIKQLGYWNFYFNGLSGTGSAPAYTDLTRSLKFGTPAYLVWCLGMNDTLADWTNVFNKLKKICSELGITLILSTIPTTPTRDKEGIKALVESSGYRYIDFYSAVGTDSSGNWYSGMLSSDDVHPTASGAKALASQVLLDFPEIMG